MGESSRPYHVYILECNDGSLYTGIARDVHKRLHVHNKGRGAKYTRSRLPVKIRAFWEWPDKSSALREEIRIKKLLREGKLDMITEWEKTKEGG